MLNSSASAHGGIYLVYQAMPAPRLPLVGQCEQLQISSKRGVNLITGSFQKYIPSQ